MFKKLTYGIGNLSYSVINQTMTSFFVFFATSILDLRGICVGIAIAISTIWDGISDTFVGFLSDNHNFLKMGKRNGFMLVASIGMAIFNLLIWCVPSNISNFFKFIWIIISLILLETFNTMFATPYMALGNELATSDNDRTKYSSVSTVFYLIGIIIPSMLMFLFLPSTDEYPQGQLNPKGYIKIAIVSSLICLITGIICSLFTRQKEKNINAKKEKLELKKIFHNFLEVYKNRKLRNIILGYVCTSMATVFLCGIGMHFFTYSLFYSTSQITFILLTLIVGTIISQPLWIKLSKKFSKDNALSIGIILTILGVFLVIFIYIFRIDLYPYSFYFMIVSVLICGIGSGALYSLPTSIYGDELIRLGGNNIATYTGALTFSSNIANAIVQLMIGILLDLIKFNNKVSVQTLLVQTGLALILFVGVQVSLIFSLMVFLRKKD